jgi:hypothetical protein
LGSRLHRSIAVARPGRAVGALLIAIWTLSLPTFAIAVATYIGALFEQYGRFTPPASPISPVTTLSALAALVTITYLTRRHGIKRALGSALVGTIAAPMIFELPFDLIVMFRTYPPVPVQLTLLYFMPLVLVEISSFSLLTLSPLMKVSNYTLFALAAMFLVFAVWAMFGFSYPSQPVPFTLNAMSKILCFATAITLFLPQESAYVANSR